LSWLLGLNGFWLKGAMLGNAMCTALAVVGGRILASRISARVLTVVGAVFFLAFCVVEAMFYSI